MAPIKLAIVGVGKIVRDQHLPAVAGNADFQLVAAASRTPWNHSREAREGLLLARIIYVAMRDARTAPSQEREQAFRESLGPRWAAVKPAFTTQERLL